MNLLVKFIFVYVAICVIPIKSEPQYLVSIKIKGYDEENIFHLCQGIIIHELFVLTSGGCTYLYLPLGEIKVKEDMLRITAGNHDNIIVNRDIVKIFRPSTINITSLENDIALLKLNESLPLNSKIHISAIDLQLVPNQNKQKNCYASFYNPMLNRKLVLQKETLEFYSNSMCSRQLRSTSVKIQNTSICSHYQAKGLTLCQGKYYLRSSGDRGAGLVCNNQLYGILSSIEWPYQMPIDNCLTERITYAIYTNISQHFNWIRNITRFEEVEITTPHPTQNSSNAVDSKKGKNGSAGNCVQILSILLPIVIARILVTL